MLGSVSLHGVRAAHVSGKLAGYRSLPPRRPAQFYHVGIRTRIARSTLAYANETTGLAIYADFAERLIRTARQLYIKIP